MIRIFNQSVPLRTATLRISEALLIFIALFVACMAAAADGAWNATTGIQVLVVGSIILFCIYCLDFYEPQVTTHQAHSLSRVLQAVGLTLVMVAVAPDNWWLLHINVATVLLALVLICGALTISRYLFATLSSRPNLAEPAMIWGSGALAATLIRELNKRPDLGIRVLGIVDSAYAGKTFLGVRNLGKPDVIWTMAESGETQRIIIATGERRGSLPVERLMELKSAGLKVEDGIDLYEDITGRVWLGGFRISSLLFSRRFGPSSIRRFLNRLFSFVFAVVALTVAAPVMMVIGILIRVDSEGPAIFRQARVGENGRHFTLFKFRSMKVGAELADTLVPATQDDPRCTRVGKWIRRFRLDELPQLFNILKGDMYFVGPRPFVPDQEAMLVREIPHYSQRWVVRPGATGWAQVHRDYCASVEDNAEKLSYDLFYIKNLSMGLDLLTLMKTFKILLLGRGGR